MNRKILIILLLLIVSCRSKNLCRFIRAVDGDTLKLNCFGKLETIRLIGVDSPESRNNRKTRRDARRSGESIESITAKGKLATKYVKNLLTPDDPVLLEFDKQKRDRYKRLLAYVYLPSGKMLNEDLIKSGHADIMTIKPNVKYQKKFMKLRKTLNKNYK